MASILLGLFITAAVYLFIPLICIGIGKPMSRRKRHFIIIFSFFIGMIIMAILKWNLMQPFTGGGAILWSLVGNWMMKQRLSLSIDPADIREHKKEDARKERINNAIASGKYRSYEDYEKRQGIIGLCIIAGLFIFAIVFFFVL